VLYYTYIFWNVISVLKHMRVYNLINCSLILDNSVMFVTHDIPFMQEILKCGYIKKCGKTITGR